MAKEKEQPLNTINGSSDKESEKQECKIKKGKKKNTKKKCVYYLQETESSTSVAGIMLLPG